MPVFLWIYALFCILHFPLLYYTHSTSLPSPLHSGLAYALVECTCCLVSWLLPFQVDKEQSCYYYYYYYSTVKVLI